LILPERWWGSSRLRIMNGIKIQPKFTPFFLLIAWLLFGWAISNSSETDPYLTIEIPVFPRAYNVQKSITPSNHTKAVSYYVQTDHPAAEILEFYDAFFNAKGWQPSFETCQRNWGSLGDKKNPSHSAPRQLFAAWEHFELKLTAALWLKADMTAKNGRNAVFVTCRLQSKMND
jgi:hypothetical protein